MNMKWLVRLGLILGLMAVIALPSIALAKHKKKKSQDSSAETVDTPDSTEPATKPATPPATEPTTAPAETK